MIPMAPTSVMPIQQHSVKPKIGFSIDSIVGSNLLRRDFNNSSPHSESPDRPCSSPLSDDYTDNCPLELRNYSEIDKRFLLDKNQQQQEINRINLISENFQKNLNTLFHTSSQLTQTTTTSSSITSKSDRFGREQSTSPTSDSIQNTTRTSSLSPPLTTNNSNHQQSSIALQSTKGPIIVPGIPAGLIRPFPVQPNVNELNKLSPYLNTSTSSSTSSSATTADTIGMSNHHILASAQFHMAAALAHHGQAGHNRLTAGIPQHHYQFSSNPNLVRDTYPLYPWLLSRHGRIFPHRFPGNFLLQPFRKPKRIRTAFSPSQLLKLEHAFENNHYVVGAERKTLAQALSLTETQVKVWFQNRRTKHKRMQQEEDEKSGRSSSSGGGGNNGDQRNCINNGNTHEIYDDESEDELIDMDDYPSD